MYMTKDELLSIGFGKASLCTATELNPRNRFELVETDPQAKLKKVIVSDIPEGALVCRLEHVALTGLTNAPTEKGWSYNKHCDYLIISDNSCIFIEMKSNPKVENVRDVTRNKFKADACLMKYADTIFEDLRSKNKFFNGKNCHYVLLYRGENLLKPLLGRKSYPANNYPHLFREIAVKNDEIVSYNDFC